MGGWFWSVLEASGLFMEVFADPVRLQPMFFRMMLQRLWATKLNFGIFRKRVRKGVKRYLNGFEDISGYLYAVNG